MKKISTLFAGIAMTMSAFAGTPTLDGTVTGGEGWGTAVATGDNIAGWDNANAKNLYFTSDATYYYFAAETVASSWKQWVFLVNSKTGGGTTDSWSRSIVYNHTDAPDYIFRGDFGGAYNYAEYHSWNGSAWTGLGTNVNASPSEAVNSVNGDVNGFIEIRVPKTLLGAISYMDIQFIVTGNNNVHGTFDAIPTQAGSNSTSWNMTSTPSQMSAYQSVTALLPLKLTSFNGKVDNSGAILSWTTTNEKNVSHFDIQNSANGTEWSTIATVNAKNTDKAQYVQSVSLNNASPLYRLKMVDADGKTTFSSVIKLAGKGKDAVSLMQNPVRNSIKLNVNSDAAKYTATVYTIQGKQIATVNFTHAGGVSTLEVPVSNIAKGNYIVRVAADNYSKAFNVLVD